MKRESASITTIKACKCYQLFYRQAVKASRIKSNLRNSFSVAEYVQVMK